MRDQLRPRTPFQNSAGCVSALAGGRGVGARRTDANGDDDGLGASGCASTANGFDVGGALGDAVRPLRFGRPRITRG